MSRDWTEAELKAASEQMKKAGHLSYEEFCSSIGENYMCTGKEKTMERFIDANKIKLTSQTLKDDEGEVYIPLSDVKSAIQQTPTEEVEKVHYGTNISRCHPSDEFICSECGLAMKDICRYVTDEDSGDESCFEYEIKRCPECGAKIKTE